MIDLMRYKDEELIAEIKSGNMFAFDLIYRRYNKKIFKLVYLILKSEEESENIVQDVFLSFWVNRNKIDKNSSARYYIFTIAYNAAISVVRKKAKEKKFLEYLLSLQRYDQGSVDLELEYKELLSQIDQIVENLPPRQKEVFLLHRDDELKYLDIGKRLKISVNTIENHMSRALRTIRSKLI
jgi:RNA polymerase sigma-70 factor (ECF subfamily)